MTEPVDRRGRRQAAVKSILIAMLLLGIDFLCAASYLHLAETSFAVLPQDKHDAAVVFWGDKAALGPETRRRIRHAVALYHNRLIEFIICVGGSRPEISFYGSDIMRKALIASGIAKDRIFVERQSFDTESNCREAIRIIQTNRFNPVVLVSDPLQMLRLRRIFAQGNVDFRTTFAPYAYESAKPQISKIEIFFCIHTEWAKRLSRLLLSDRMYRTAVRWYRSSMG